MQLTLLCPSFGRQLSGMGKPTRKGFDLAEARIYKILNILFDSHRKNLPAGFNHGKGALKIRIRDHHLVHAARVLMTYHTSTNNLLPFSNYLVSDGNDKVFTF